MGQFFAASLGPRAAGVDNIYLDWGRIVDAIPMAAEHAWSAPEAFLCILLGAALCDGEFSDEERETARVLAHRSRALGSLSSEQFEALQGIVADRLRVGADVAVQAASAALPAEIRLPAFAHALDIALADGDLSQSEADFLNTLIAQLALDPADVRRVAEVIVLKNQC